MAHKCFRRPESTGPYVYYARDEDGVTFQVKGEDAKFNFDEATLIEKGHTPASILVRRENIAAKEAASKMNTPKHATSRTPKPETNGDKVRRAAREIVSEVADAIGDVAADMADMLEEN